jgi:hypothetical protein
MHGLLHWANTAENLLYSAVLLHTHVPGLAVLIQQFCCIAVAVLTVLLYCQGSGPACVAPPAMRDARRLPAPPARPACPAPRPVTVLLRSTFRYLDGI